MECFRRLNVISFREAEVNQDGDVLVRKQYVRRPVKISILSIAVMSNETNNSLYIVVHDTVLVEKLDSRQQRAEPVFSM